MSSMIASQVLLSLHEFAEHFISPSQPAYAWHRGQVEFRNPYARYANECGQ